MKLASPYKTQYFISQRFGQNFSTYYKDKGLLGHSGVDMVGKHLDHIYAVIDSYCFAIRDNPDPTLYRAAYTLAQIDGAWYEIVYGHAWTIFVTPGAVLKAGHTVISQGNTGNVFVGGKAVTLEQRKKGAGSHLHLQMRKVQPVDVKVKGKQYLYDHKGPLKYLSRYWEVLDFNNGFQGAIDIMPFLEPKTPLKTRIKALQELLNAHGASLTADGVFGPLTKQALDEFLI